MAVLIAVQCPACGDTETIVKFGRTHNEKQRYRCRSVECKKATFIIDHERKGWLPEIKEKIIAMTLNGSGIRDISRVLGICSETVIREIKKKESILQPINTAVLASESKASRVVDLVKVEEVEADEMWSFVGNKRNQRWLWHAFYHETGKVLAYVIGQHQDSVLLKLKALLKPFGVRHFFTDSWGGYERHINAEQLSIGKKTLKK